jgi:alanine racemase
MMKQFKPRESLTWAEIDLSALSYNVNLVKKTVSSREIIPVIKANAYGHGAVPLALYLMKKHSIRMFGLARVSEGVRLREQGIKGASLIILGGFFRGEIDAIIEYGLEPSVFSVEEARALNAAALKRKIKIDVHAKINTGMNRLGVRPADAYSLFGNLRGMQGLNLRSVYTHFANSDVAGAGDFSTQKQADELKTVREIAGAGVMFHAANSAAVAKYPFSYFDAVRPGIMLYGSYGDKAIKNIMKVKPVMTLKSRVIHTANLEAGGAVSYGATYRAKKNEKIAVVGIGYADGFMRSLSNKWYVLINGREAPVLGRVCMDMIVVRLSKDVKVGDEALIFGGDKSGSIDAEDMAAAAGTISYEVFTGVSDRVVRVYKY